MAEWPALPDIYLVEPCPPNTKCISDSDHVKIINREMALDRIHSKLLNCEWVRFQDLSISKGPLVRTH